MRSILLHIHNDRCLDASLRVAFDLARGFNGHVTCLQSVPLDVGVGDFYGIAVEPIIQELRESAEVLREKLESQLAEAEVTWDWIVDYDWPRLTIREHAPLNDLVILGACDDTGGKSNYSGLAADLAINLRTPVLLVPADSPRFDIGAPVVIAWNSSGESANAMRAALPLLRSASSVTLLQIAEKSASPQLSITAAFDFLARHDIPSEIAEEPCLKEGVAATLLHFAQRRGAGAVVMGAYGHTRLREFALGGVTRTMMENAHIPLLLTH